MRISFFRLLPLSVCASFVSVLASLPAGVVAEERPIDFNRDVRPILSDNCFHCHGPDAKNQKSDYRLDTAENLYADLGGFFGVKPGSLKDSELHWRIHSEDDSEVMPPADSNRSLTKKEKAILDRWIEEGAPYAKHWAFEPPQRPEVPEASERYGEHPVDAFVHQRLAEKGWSFSPPASKETLLRRASLVLTGLLPTPEQMDAFQKDERSDAFARALRNLMDTDAYAERQTLRWLDAARFADTDGYQNDAERSNWPWRDWVIQAYRDNKPFDQFTIEQLAGDMLPDATPSQVLASAFNRNHRQNSEGGALSEEFFVENVIDRVETTSTVWLGLTMGCARCHDHKYDPLSQREFYQFFAYFNNIGERGTGKGITANPILKTASPLVTVPEDLLTRKAEAEAAMKEAGKGRNLRQEAWVAALVKAHDAAKQAATEAKAGSGETDWQIAPLAGASSDLGNFALQEDDSWLFSGSAEGATYTLTLEPGEGQITGIQLEALTHEAFTKPRQLSTSTNGNFVLSEVKVELDGKPIQVAEAQATFNQSGFEPANLIDGNPKSGWAVFDKAPADVAAYLLLSLPIETTKDSVLTLTLHHGSHYAHHNVGRVRVQLSDKPSPSTGEAAPDETVSKANLELVKAARVEPGKRNRNQKKLVSDEFEKQDPAIKKAKRELDAINKILVDGGFEQVPVMVMQEREGEPIPAYFLNRGSYLEPDTSEAMVRQVPAALFDGMPDEQPKDRLELAQWLVSPQNPLTARVFVNRVWQSIFGIGLVKTVEDFGVQGEIPLHAGLLDWLAVEFVETGWDLRELYALILTSKAFQQQSVLSAELVAEDPENRLMARGPRHRLDGFAIRDNALQAAGLLDTRVGGKPVKPYQPEGLWNSVNQNAGFRYVPSQGGDLYRKSLYTYWKRAVNPPRQIIFDAAGREACNVNARVTNTPLQALVLMNDVTFVEAARHLAEQGLKGQGDKGSLAAMYRRATSRAAAPETLAVLEDSLAWYRKHYQADPDQAEAFLAAGESPRDESLDLVEHAAHAAVAHLILNLDETITLE